MPPMVHREPGAGRLITGRLLLLIPLSQSYRGMISRSNITRPHPRELQRPAPIDAGRVHFQTFSSHGYPLAATKKEYA